MSIFRTDGLYAIPVCFSDGDVTYNNCVPFPTGDKPLKGEFHLEPFDSLYGRFIAFEISAQEEIKRRAKESWEEILDFVKSLDRKSLAADSPYQSYIDEADRLDWSIAMSEGGYRDVDYPRRLGEFFMRIERRTDPRQNSERGAR